MKVKNVLRKTNSCTNVLVGFGENTSSRFFFLANQLKILFCSLLLPQRILLLSIIV
jgi:hypothetical protein